eukprot:Gb_39650 [translate_table: standard]
MGNTSMAVINEDGDNPSWSLLPNDVALHIASMLQVPDLCALGSSSVFWRHLCASDLIWVSLSRKRWPNLDLFSDSTRSVSKKEEKSEQPDNSDVCQLAELVPSPQGWQAFYIQWHTEMADRAVSVVELVKQSACYESLEVGDYQRALELLCTTELGFKDVQLYLFTPKHSVLLNLIGLHYCLVHLGIQSEDVRTALAKSQIANRHVCLRWWSLGQWMIGFRRSDEMHVRIASLAELLKPKQQELLNVLQRGTVHEVLRVQISADFRTSAWIAREMHSQR